MGVLGPLLDILLSSCIQNLSIRRISDDRQVIILFVFLIGNQIQGFYVWKCKPNTADEKDGKKKCNPAGIDNIKSKKFCAF